MCVGGGGEDMPRVTRDASKCGQLRSWIKVTGTITLKVSARSARFCPSDSSNDRFY